MTSISNIWKQLTSILSNLNNFHSLEVVDRVSETQLQVGENSKWIIWRLKGWRSQSWYYISPPLCCSDRLYTFSRRFNTLVFEIPIDKDHVKTSHAKCWSIQIQYRQTFVEWFKIHDFQRSTRCTTDQTIGYGGLHTFNTRHQHRNVELHRIAPINY